MIDTHCHLNDPKFKNDLDEVISRALDAGIRAMVVVGYDVRSSIRAVEISQRYDGVYATVGLHPYEAERYKDDNLREIEELLKPESAKRTMKVNILAQTHNPSGIFLRYFPTLLKFQTPNF